MELHCGSWYYVVRSDSASFNIDSIFALQALASSMSAVRAQRLWLRARMWPFGNQCAERAEKTSCHGDGNIVDTCQQVELPGRSRRVQTECRDRREETIPPIYYKCAWYSPILF